MLFDRSADPFNVPKWRGPQKTLDLRDPSEKVTSRDDGNEHKSIWTPQIENAVVLWERAKEEGDEGALKSAARQLVEATSGYFRMSGMPTFAHHPLPPQVVGAEISEAHRADPALQSDHLRRFVDMFDERARRAVVVQTSSMMRDLESAFEERSGQEVAGPSPAQAGTLAPIDEGKERTPWPRWSIEEDRIRRSPGERRQFGREMRTQEYNPTRDTPEWVLAQQQLTPFEALPYVPEEGRAKFMRDVEDGTVAGARLLAQALYEISPLSDAVDFVEDVRAGNYASAALTILMAGIPAGKALRVSHHILAKLAKQHQDLRRLMGDFGIDINDPVNLAKMVEDAHRVVHTDSYYRYVRQRVAEAKTADDLRAALGDVKKLLERLEGRAMSRQHFPPKRPPKK